VRRLPRRVLLLDEDKAQEAVAERALRAEGFEVLTPRGDVEALRRAAHLPVDLVLLSASAPTSGLGSLLEAFAGLPRARPVPIVLAGAERPAWAQPHSALCARPYRAEDLLEAVRATLGLPGERHSVGEYDFIEARSLP
jgi:CheY-like chemotaxis protein